jgi:PAS domain S-box-containing protein
MVIANDITEKIAAEEELNRNELRFRTLTGNAPVGIFQTDAAGKTIYVNETWMKYTGLTFDEAMDNGWQKVLHPDDREKQIQQWQEKLQHGLESSSELRLIDKNGNTRWVIGKATPLYNKNKQITGYIGTISDITENKKAEEIIQKSEEQYRDLVENISDLICTHDLTGKILSVNRAAEELVGHKFSPDQNYNIKDILAPDKKNEFDQYIEAIKKQGRVQGLMKVKTFGGKIHIWQYNNSLKTDGVDEPIVRGYARDITESKKAEEDLRKSNERFKYAAQATSDIIWELNFETKSYLVHEGAEKFFGAKRDLGWETGVEAKYIVDEDRDRVKESFRAARLNPACELWSEEYSIWGVENNILNIINRAILIRDKNGRAIRAIGAITDITEKKKLETKLLEQQKQAQVRITAIALEAQEKERNAIGVELHDNVNQILVGTKLLLSTVKDDFERSKVMIASCMKNLQDAIDENRKIAHALVTPDLDTLP